MASVHRANPTLNQVEVGTTKRLGDERRWGYTPNILIEYYDKVNDEWCGVEMCVDGARALARELNTVARMIDPPKPRKGKSS